MPTEGFFVVGRGNITVEVTALISAMCVTGGGTCGVEMTVGGCNCGLQ